MNCNTYRQLPEATAEQNKIYFQKAKDFLRTTGGLYSSTGSEAACAIADYLAHLDGLQLKRTK